MSGPLDILVGLLAPDAASGADLATWITVFLLLSPVAAAILAAGLGWSRKPS